jgi:hypothetical protein
MKRRALQIIVLLLLGAIVNVAVAYTLVSTFGWSLQFYLPEPVVAEGCSMIPCNVVAGWPTSAIRQNNNLKEGTITQSPVCPGFAINTIFYAAILWVLFFAPGKVRRSMRRRRGLCPACGYPVGMSEVCTECGLPIRVDEAP